MFVSNILDVRGQDIDVARSALLTTG